MTRALPLALSMALSVALSMALSKALSVALSVAAMGETVPRRAEGPSTARWRNHP